MQTYHLPLLIEEQPCISHVLFELSIRFRSQTQNDVINVIPASVVYSVTAS